MNVSPTSNYSVARCLSVLTLLAGVLTGPLVSTGFSEEPAAGQKACCAAGKSEPSDCGGTTGCAASPATGSLSEKWGIEVVALRLSAGGNMLDFRYKVLDSEKAAPISHVEWKPYLIDEKTGAKMVVPKMPKIGSLRQTAVKPVVGRIYAMLFTNPGQTVKSGSKVTVVIGECRIENITVQ